MDKKLKRELLKSGGKKALAEYNRLKRIPLQQMNMGTRVHNGARHKKQKHKDLYCDKYI